MCVLIFSAKEMMVETLIKNGAKLNLENDLGQTVVHIATDLGWYINYDIYPFDLCDEISFIFFSEIHDYDLGLKNIVKILIEKGANINIKDNKGDSAFVLALKKGKHLRNEIIVHYRIWTICCLFKCIYKDTKKSRIS